MATGDDWLALDKLYHLVFCFFLTLLCSTAAARTRYAFLRRRAIWVGSITALAAGAAKEAADELGIFPSAGASSKDAAADVLGTLLATLALLMCRRCYRPENLGPGRGASLV